MTVRDTHNNATAIVQAALAGKNFEIARTRRCSACGSDKPLNADHFSRSSKPGEGGFQYNCKACSRALRQEWRRKNRERDNLGRKLLRAGLSIREGGEERMSKPIPGVIYQCKAATCAATVMWVKLPSGAYLLVNVQPDVERGAVRVTGTDGVVLPKLEAEAARISGEPLHRAHNETCINRQQFERARRNGGRELQGDRVSDLREAA